MDHDEACLRAVRNADVAAGSLDIDDPGLNQQRETPRLAPPDRRIVSRSAMRERDLAQAGVEE